MGDGCKSQVIVNTVTDRKLTQMGFLEVHSLWEMLLGDNFYLQFVGLSAILKSHDKIAVWLIHSVNEANKIKKENTETTLD